MTKFVMVFHLSIRVDTAPYGGLWQVYPYQRCNMKQVCPYTRCIVKQEGSNALPVDTDILHHPPGRFIHLLDFSLMVLE